MNYNQVLSYLSSLTQTVNSFISNSKKIEELPEQITIVPSSEIHVSESGTSKRLKISKIVSLALSLFQNNVNDKFTTIGTITRNENEFTFDGFEAIIGGETVTMLTSETITIEEAADGFKRIDIAVLNSFGHVLLIYGQESETIALQPTIPTGTLLITTWNIDGNQISDNTNIIVSDFVKKSFAAHFAFNSSGVDTSIPLNPNGYSEIRVTNPALESIAGVDLSLISGNPSAEVPYTGKMYLLKNITGKVITIKHNSAIADIPFYTNDEQNLEVPNKGSVIFTYDNAACEILLTNFSVGTASIPSLDEVLEVSGYSERSATVGDFKAKSFQIGDNLMPESSGGLFKVQKNADGTISVVLDSVSHNDSDNFGKLTATLTNERGVIFRHLDNDNNQGVIARIRKDGIMFSLINSFLKVYKDGSDRDILISGIAQINDIFGLGLALNNKADLFNGIVPQEQSQGSSLIMESSSYKIIYTNPRGEVYEIDLPIESLFRDANYNSETKKLILTLDSGDTIEVSLEDLVDLPEIQIENINPSVSPSDGKKVYFNISNGKIYLNYQNEWAFLGNAISDTEKANIITAYNHSQATGNPHGTTATGVGALKLDGSNANSDVNLGNNNLSAKGLKVNGTAGSGNLRLKHQSSNATAGGQETALFAGSDGELYYKNDSNDLAQIASRTWVNENFASKFFSHKLTTPTSYVTGTVSETEIYRLPLPPGSFNPVDVLKIPLMLIKKLGTNGTVQVIGRMSTSPTMPTGTTDLIFRTPVAPAGNQTLGIIKTFFIDNGNIKGTQFTGPAYTDNGAGAGVISEKPFDIAVTNYLYLSVINGSASDQTRLEAFQLTNS